MKSLLRSEVFYLLLNAKLLGSVLQRPHELVVLQVTLVLLADRVQLVKELERNAEGRAHHFHKRFLVVRIVSLCDFRQRLNELLVVRLEERSLLVVPEPVHHRVSLVVRDRLLLCEQRVPHLLLVLLRRCECLTRDFQQLGLLARVLLQLLCQDLVLLLLVEVGQRKHGANDGVTVCLLQRDTLDHSALRGAHLLILEPLHGLDDVVVADEVEEQLRVKDRLKSFVLLFLELLPEQVEHGASLGGSLGDLALLPPRSFYALVHRIARLRLHSRALRSQSSSVFRSVCCCGSFRKSRAKRSLRARSLTELVLLIYCA